MRLICKNLVALSLMGLGTSCAFAADNLELPPLPPPPPAAGGAEVPSVPAAPSLPLPAAPAATAPAASTPAAPASLPALPLPAAPTATTPITPALPAPTAEPATRDITPALPTHTAAAGGTPGKIVGGRVNVRAGEGTRYEIVLTTGEDTPVTVFKRNGDWVQIGYPENEFCYIEQSAIEGELPADIADQGISRSIKGSKVSVRSRPWPGSSVVGELNAGDTVLITNLRGQWAKIRPPASARAWVFAKYVTFEKGSIPESGAVSEGPAESNSAKSGEKDKDSPRAHTPANSGRKGEVYKKSGEDDPVLAQLRGRAETERQQRDSFRQQTQDILGSLDAEMSRIEQESADRIRRVYDNRDRFKQYQGAAPQIDENYKPRFAPGSLGGRAVGWVEYVGYFNGRPAGYQLVKGGEILYLLRSGRYDLHKFIGRQVVVGGPISSAPSWEADVLDVDTLSLLTAGVEEVQPATGSAPAPRSEPAVSAPRPARRDNRVVIDVTGLEPKQQ